MEPLQDILKKTSVSGHEGELGSFIMESFKKCRLKTETSKCGNIIGVKKGSSDKRKVLIDAHYDQVGLIVKKIDGPFLRIKNIGGIDYRVLPGSEVRVYGKKVLRGIFAAKPPHLLRKGETDKAISSDDLLVDTGLDEKELKDNVSPGDIVAYNVEPFTSGKYTFGSGIDNRAGALVLLKLAEFLRDHEVRDTVVLRTTVMEETGGRGAAMEEDFDIAVVIDATFAKQQGTKDDCVFNPDDGITLSYGPNYSRRLTKEIEEIAKKHGIKTQREVEESVRGTNAFRYAVLSGGHEVIGISYPMYNMHAPCEAVKSSLVDNMADMLMHFIIESSDAGRHKTEGGTR